MPRISSSAAPSNTGVANGTPLDRLPAISRTSSSLSVVEVFGLAARLVVQLVEELAQLGHLGLLLQHVADALADALAGPAQVHLEHLADVHPRRHAQRIEHDVARRAVGHVGHVLDRNDLRHHALVAVAAGHLVAGLQAALDGQVDLDHLQHAGRQLVALRQLLALLFEGEVEAVARLLERVLDRLELVGDVVVRRADVEPVVLLDRLARYALSIVVPLASLLRAAVGDLADQQLLDPVERVGLDDAQLVVQVEAEALELVVDDLLGALVALDAFTGEDLHVDHGAVACPGRRAARCPSRRKPSRRRSRAAAFLPASAWSRPSA